MFLAIQTFDSDIMLFTMSKHWLISTLNKNIALLKNKL